MNFGTRATVKGLLFGLLSIPTIANADIYSDFVKEAALENGLKRSNEINLKFDKELSSIGRVFFESKSMSINGKISCQTCHLDKFGSTDGIPNGIGVGGVGEGADRVLHGGAIVPRNTLPLWGRAIEEFSTFFWDGKVQKTGYNLSSQFGASAPSKDPLIVAIHLPVVEIREMLEEDQFVSSMKKESVSAASNVYEQIIERLKSDHPKVIGSLAKHRSKDVGTVSFQDIAISIQHFFRDKFAIQAHKFENFMFNGGSLTTNELRGAFLFYGKGKCSVCHSGTLFSDLSFHGIPMGQIGSGKNGFGIDYGRFNITHDPRDLYKFRVPPLLDVANTAPYGHSGNIGTITEAIRRHFDPLKFVDARKLTALQRNEIYKQLSSSASSAELIPFLTDEETFAISEFLKTLSFNPRSTAQKSTD